MPATTVIKPSEAATVSSGAGAVTTLRIDGMICGNCARHVTEALQSVSGVQHASVTLQTGRGQVRWQASAQKLPQELIRAIEEAGYSAETVEPVEAKAASESLDTWALNLWSGAVITGLLMIGE